MVNLIICIGAIKYMELKQLPKEATSVLVKNLETDGFYVQKGSMEEFDTIALATEGTLSSCFGNNQGSPYFTYFLPPAPNQTPVEGGLEKPSQYYNPTAEDNYPANPRFDPIGWSYKLREDEAIVSIMKLPPKCKYFSIGAYILLKTNTIKYENSNVEQKNVYVPIFGSIEDQKNNYNIKSLATPNGEKGKPYGSIAVFIMSGDKNISETIKKQLIASGYNKSMINESIIPATALNMGLEEGKDTFCMVGRISQPESQKACKAYFKNMAYETQVFRVTPKIMGKIKPYNMPKLPARGTKMHEAGIIPHANKDLAIIRENIINQYKRKYTYEELAVNIAAPEGMTAYYNDRNALGDNRDTTYLMTSDFILNSDDDFIIVYGVNHVKTRKSIYSNTILYARPMLNGVASIYDSDYEGSANSYLINGYQCPSYYYVYKMGRKKEKNTVVIPKSTGNLDGKYYGVDNGDPMLLAFRAYIEVKSGIGPSYYEIIYDRAIVFRKK